MSLGTLTKVKDSAALGPLFATVCTLVLDGAYPTNGSTGLQTAFQALGNEFLGREIFAVLGVDGKGYFFGWDDTNNKLKVYYIDNNGASDGPAIEVPNATDLSAVTATLLILSK